MKTVFCIKHPDLWITLLFVLVFLFQVLSIYNHVGEMRDKARFNLVGRYEYTFELYTYDVMRMSVIFGAFIFVVNFFIPGGFVNRNIWKLVNKYVRRKC